MRTIAQQETRMSSRIGIATSRFDPSLNISKKKSTKSKIKPSRLPRKRKSCYSLKEPKRSEYIPKEHNELELQLPMNPRVGLYPSPGDDDYNFVDNIVARRQTIKGGKWEFKVRYLGWDSKCDHWQTFRYLNNDCRRIVYERYTNIQLPPVDVTPEQLQQVQQEMDEVKRVTDKRNERFRKQGLPFYTREKNSSDDEDATQASLGNDNFDNHSEMDYIQDNDDDQSIIEVWSARNDDVRNGEFKTSSHFVRNNASSDHNQSTIKQEISETMKMTYEKDENFRNQAISFYTIINNNRSVDNNKASSIHKSLDCHYENDEDVLPESYQFVKQVKTEDRETLTDERNEVLQRQNTPCSTSTMENNNHYNGNKEESSSISHKSLDHHIGKNNVPSTKQQHQSIKQEMHETTKKTRDEYFRKQLLPLYILENNNCSVDKTSSSHKSLDCHSEKDNVLSEPHQFVKQVKAEREKLTDERNDDLQQQKDIPFAFIENNKASSNHEGLYRYFGKKNVYSEQQKQPIKQEIVEITNTINASINEIQKQAIQHFHTIENNNFPDNSKSSSSHKSTFDCHSENNNRDSPKKQQQFLKYSRLTDESNEELRKPSVTFSSSFCSENNNNVSSEKQQQFVKHARLTDESNDDLRKAGVVFSSSFCRANNQYDDNNKSSSSYKSLDHHHSDKKYYVQNSKEEVTIDDDDESSIEAWSVHDGNDINESKRSSHLQTDSVKIRSNASIEEEKIRNKTSFVTNISKTTPPEHIPITTMEAPMIMESLNNLHNKLNNLHNILEKAGFCCDPAPIRTPMNDDNRVRPSYKVNVDVDDQGVVFKQTKPFQNKVRTVNSSEVIVLDDDDDK